MDRIDFQPINSRQSANRTNLNRQRYNKQSLTRSPESDSVEIRQNRQQKLHQRDKKNQMRCFIAGVAAAITILGGGKAAVDKIGGPQANFDAQGRTVAEAADFCDVDSRAIMLANDISDETQSIDDIILPEKYNALDKEIEEAQKAVDEADSAEELQEAEEKLAELQDIKAKQDELAQVYVVEDGKYAYIIPNETGISSEDIKDAFGIEDGVLRKYNDLSYDWGVNEEVEVHQGYKDYTGSSIPDEGVKLPKDELGQEY